MSSSAAQSSGAALGGQLEDRVDLSEETAVKISQAQQLVAAGSSSSSLQDALALLAALEKRCRVGNDLPSLVKVCQASLVLCHGAGDSEALLATLKTLATRRSQKSKAIAALVSTCLPWVVDADGDGFTPLPTEGGAEIVAARDALVEELRGITDGKMYLEAERARLTRTAAIIREAAGDVAGAADVLQEVHVETYGSISKREKIEFILEQMRLTLMKEDWIRAYIVSNKVKRAQLDEEGMATLKVKFYSLLTRYYRHERMALELARCYHAIYATPSVQEDEVRWREALTNTVVFLCLGEYSNEVKDMMERVSRDARLEKVPECAETLACFLRDEIMHYPLPHQVMLESIPAFRDDTGNDSDGGTLKKHWHTTFRTRVVQHNLRVAALYYRQIHTSRLAALLNLTPAETDRHISQMVSSGTLYAKIDRPKDIVRFMKKRSEEEVLSDWGADIKTLLGLVEETTYLIQKENMLQSH